MLLPLANFFGMDPMNWAFVAVIALLLFGKRLPEVGRSLGKGIVEFKKGLAGVEEELTQAGQKPASTTDRPAIAAGYKFDPYTGKPIGQDSAPSQMRFDPYTGKPLIEQSSSSPTSSNT